MIPSSPPAASGAASGGQSLYDERLWCPASYWVIAFGIGLSFVAAIGLYLNPWAAAICTILASAMIGTVLLRLGHVRVRVDADGLLVGECRLGWEYLGEVSVLSRAESSLRLGAQADARAYMVERPYLAEMVEVAVADSADPHPYWLISTRRPGRLSQALMSGREAFAKGLDE